jgi:hypothetical protein
MCDGVHGHFGQLEAFTLIDHDHDRPLVPVGFAHGCCVTSNVADACRGPRLADVAAELPFV